jgi:type IV pilus assembly protein PilO
MTIFEQLARFSIGKKLGILFGLLGIVAVIYFVGLYASLRKELSTIENIQKKLKEEERIAKRDRDNFLRKREELLKRKERQIRQEQILPRNADMPGFLESINSLGELAGLTLFLVRPLEEEIVGFYAKIPVELKIQGRFHQLAKFFYMVSKLERIINIENIEITEPKLKEGGELILNTDCLATTFRAVSSKEIK